MKTRNIILFGLLFLSYQQIYIQKDDAKQKLGFNQDLADELNKLAKADQLAASNAFPPEKFKNLTQKKWEDFKDSVFRTHETSLEKIFIKFGYPGYSLVGKKGEFNFWLMVQHCDFAPDFQLRVLQSMKIEVEKNNADPGNYAYLTDRELINTGKQQIFGTQITYNSIGQAYPINLVDSANVNKRRKEKRMEPIEEYLNRMTESHFDMNKDYFIKAGITEPKLYKVTNDSIKIKN
ncbi:MAG: DUF6624 domain-containing protein [Bacteroidales bacterium]|jgi:hypothetical protein